MIKYFFLFLLTCIISDEINAQISEVTEAQVQEEALFIQGLQEKILGNIDKAIKLFERIVKEHPNNDVAYFQLSQLYTDIESGDKAFESIQKATSINPDNHYYQRELANQYETQNAYASAAKIYQKLYKAGESDIPTLDKWAYACAKSNDYDQAIQVLSIIERKYGFSLQLARKQYDVYILQKKPNKAEAVLIRLVEKDSNNTQALSLLAMHYKQSGKKDKANEYFQRILQIDPNDSKANIALADDFKRTGQDDKFLNSISTIIENPNVDVDIKIKEIIPYVDKLSNQSNTDLSKSLIKVVQSLEEIHPDEAKVYALGGDIYYHAGFYDEAIEKYTKAVEIRSDIWSVWDHLLYVSAEHGRAVDLVKLTTRAKDYFPNQALVYYMHAIGQAKLNNYDLAITELDEASLMVGKEVKLKIDITSLKGTIYRKLGKFDEAIESLEESLNLNPDHLPSLNAYSQVLLSQNTDLERAEQYINKGLAMNSSFYPLLASKGKLYYLKEAYDEAKDWLHKAIEKQGGSDTALLEVLGDTYFQLQQVDQAILYWQRALELNSPNQKILQQKINTKSLIK